VSNTERLFFIDARIRDHGSITVDDVVRRFEVSARQVKRDFEYLRDRLGAPLQWVPSARHHVYGQPWKGLGFASEKALLFYVFARAAAGTLAYVPIAEAGALESLRSFVPKDLRALERSIRYELPDFEPVDAEWIGMLLGAIRRGGAVQASYRDVEGRKSERILVPRRIVNYGGTWYTLAYDPALDELRTFRLARFQRISPTSEPTACGPDEAEVDSFLDSSYGMFKGRADRRASVRFRGHAREIVRRELWHPEQVRREGMDPKDGPWLELDIPVSQWDEVLGRILRFGPEAEAVGPVEFRECWLASIDALVAMVGRGRHYTDDGDKGRHR
jgi:predicted DNA-binding transcriptional regulator YafY